MNDNFLVVRSEQIVATRLIQDLFKMHFPFLWDDPFIFFKGCSASVSPAFQSVLFRLKNIILAPTLVVLFICLRFVRLCGFTLAVTVQVVRMSSGS